MRRPRKSASWACPRQPVRFRGLGAASSREADTQPWDERRPSSSSSSHEPSAHPAPRHRRRRWCSRAGPRAGPVERKCRARSTAPSLIGTTDQGGLEAVAAGAAVTEEAGRRGLGADLRESDDDHAEVVPGCPSDPAAQSAPADRPVRRREHAGVEAGRGVVGRERGARLVRGLRRRTPPAPAAPMACRAS